jgi:RNA polymerase sigma-70 factor (ECF subfamily)
MTASRSAELQALVDEHWPTVLAFARRVARRPHDAEDIAQQTFFQAFGAWERFEHRSSVRTWLLRIAVRVAMRVLRGREPSHDRLETGEGPEARDGAEPVGALVEAERSAVVRRAIENLARGHRLVLTLFALEGLAHAEIAEVMECPQGTVWSRLHHAKRALARVLDPELLENER